MQKYDIIIAGTGAAGLSLAYFLSFSSYIKGKKVLLLDKEKKDKNDRTWGFWTRERTAFDDIASYSFDEAEFISSSYSAVLSLQPYRYQVVQGKRFYDFVLKQLKEKEEFVFIQTDILALQEVTEGAVVHTHSGDYKGNIVFNSCFLDEKLKRAANEAILLRQHFKGYIIRVQEDFFDSSKVRLFDFRTAQKKDMRFFYVIPHNARQALVEYTIFSEHLLDEEAYDDEIKRYIRDELVLNNYEVIEEEWGAIPMSTYNFPAKEGHSIINIGSVGGASKPSTGYTFLRVQKQARQIVKQLEARNKVVNPSLHGGRFELYDAMLLNIMDKKGELSESIFVELFKNNPVQRILKFLDEETNFLEELLIMNSVPRTTFIKSLLNLKVGTPF